MPAFTRPFQVTDEQRRAFEEGFCALPFVASAAPFCFERRSDGDYASPFINGAFCQYCLQEIHDGHLTPSG